MADDIDFRLSSPAPSTTPGVITPTNSSVTSEFNNRTGSTITIYRESIPSPGNTYIIREPKSKLYITLIDGHIRLEKPLGDQGGYHWKCHDAHGWLAFSSPVSGGYIRYNPRTNTVTTVFSTPEDDRMITRIAADGNQVLLVRDREGLRYICMGSGEHDTLRGTTETGTPWEFVKV
ncbi:hypothetical protein M426DRAFT_28156 [Hypoxylon sp. CI-4A]|nr:hypothetical protein M426DRAFT_28156 [Hypoxylon sp. CI-4A]